MTTRCTAIAVAVLALTAGLVGTGTPAGAGSGSFTATCTFGPTTSSRSYTYRATAPDIAESGSGFEVDVGVDYAVPEVSGVLTVGSSGFDVVGATPLQPQITVGSGVPEIAGTLALTATGPIGSTITVELDRFGAAGFAYGHAVAETCRPDSPLIVARIPIGVPSVSVGDASVVEGDRGSRSARFAVSLSRPTDHDVVVDYATAPAEATAGVDYSTRTGAVVVPAGHVSAVVSVPVRGDTAVEPKESFRIQLGDPQGAALGRASATGRILDDDPAAGLRVAVGDASIVEGRFGTRALRITVSLSAAASSSVSVSYTTVAGTASAGEDYATRAGVLAIPAGATSGAVSVPVRADAALEGTESLGFRISNPVNAAIGRTTGVAKILDDD